MTENNTTEENASGDKASDETNSEESALTDVLEDVQDVPKATVAKIVGGASVVLIVMKYARGVAQIAALSVLTYAVTYMLRPFYGWAAYLNENMWVFIAGVVAGMYLLVALFGRKKTRPAKLSENSSIERDHADRRYIEIDGERAYLDEEKNGLLRAIAESPRTVTAILIIALVGSFLFAFGGDTNSENDGGVTEEGIAGGDSVVEGNLGIEIPQEIECVPGAYAHVNHGSESDFHYGNITEITDDAYKFADAVSHDGSEDIISAEFRGEGRDKVTCYDRPLTKEGGEDNG